MLQHEHNHTSLLLNITITELHSSFCCHHYHTTTLLLLTCRMRKAASDRRHVGPVQLLHVHGPRLTRVIAMPELGERHPGG
eukprot:768683-Hanusia_phi.AAC.7